LIVNHHGPQLSQQTTGTAPRVAATNVQSKAV
jgi:hypothetical protein